MKVVLDTNVIVSSFVGWAEAYGRSPTLTLGFAALSPTYNSCALR